MAGNSKKTIVWVCEPYFKLNSSEYFEEVVKEPKLTEGRTLIISTKADVVEAYRIRRGFEYLDGWDMAVLLSSEGYSLEDILTGAKKEQAKRMIPDLRIPMLDAGFMWASPRALDTFSLWQKLQNKLNYSSLALTIAVYLTCPFVMILPAKWIWRGEESGMVKGKKVYVKNTANHDIERAGRVFRAGHRKRMFMPIPLEAEIRACRFLEFEED